MKQQDFRKREEKLEKLNSELRSKIGKIVENIKNGIKVNDSELVFIIITIVEIQGLTNELVLENSKKALMADSMVSNLSSTSGSVIDLLAGEIDQKIGGIINTKFHGIKSELENFSGDVVDKFDIYQKDNDNRLKAGIDKVFKLLKNNEKQIQKELLKVLKIFVISIIGGFVSIQLYQHILFRMF